ncbi:ATP-binding cassette domain-containing protein [Paenibacillus tengchongensis]|uniref:ATP-binding cassette domain-containing protein n=1 Tax=Paenibacillus tengchongensis TaxID=2608684 RepID=UPI0016526FA1|nr:ABC transporter ATP-binding protein [Paenibacillus tengchongensis]
MFKKYASLKPLDGPLQFELRKYLIFQYLNAGIVLIVPFLVKYLFDDILLEMLVRDVVLWLIVSGVAVLLVHLFTFYCIQYSGDRLATRLSNSFRKKQLLHVMKLSPRQYGSLDKDLLFNAVYAETGVISAAFINACLIWKCMLQVAVYLVILFFISWPFGIVVLVSLGLYGLAALFNTGRFQQSIEAERISIDGLTRRIRTLLDGKIQARLYRKEAFLVDYADESMKDWENKRIRYNFWYTLLAQVPAFLTDIVPILIYGTGAVFILLGWSTIGTAIFITQFIALLFSAMQDIAGIWVEQNNVLPYLDRFRTVLDVIPETYEYGILSGPEIAAAAIHEGAVYRGGQLLFRSESLTLGQSGLFLLQGRNGSGKTTLLDNLAGLETDLPVSLRPKKTVAYFKSPCLYIEGTVLDNIWFGSAPESVDHLQSVAGMLDIGFLHQTIHLQPLNLSLGQQQKVALARFLVNQWDKTVWLLDEPFVNLDKDTAARLREFLLQEAQTRLILLVTHEDMPDTGITARIQIAESRLFFDESRAFEHAQ